MNEKAIEMLEALAAKLNTSVEFLWSVLLKQAVVNGIFDLVTVIFFCAFGYGYYRFVQWSAKAKDDGSFMSDIGYPILLVIGGGTCAVFLASTPWYLYDATTSFLNPEYWAFKQIISTVR